MNDTGESSQTSNCSVKEGPWPLDWALSFRDRAVVLKEGVQARTGESHQTQLLGHEMLKTRMSH